MILDEKLSARKAISNGVALGSDLMSVLLCFSVRMQGRR